MVGLGRGTSIASFVFLLTYPRVAPAALTKRWTELTKGQGCGVKTPFAQDVISVDGPRPCQEELKPCQLIFYLVTRGKR